MVLQVLHNLIVFFRGLLCGLCGLSVLVLFRFFHLLQFHMRLGLSEFQVSGVRTVFRARVRTNYEECRGRGRYKRGAGEHWSYPVSFRAMGRK